MQNLVLNYLKTASLKLLHCVYHACTRNTHVCRKQNTKNKSSRKCYFLIRILYKYIFKNVKQYSNDVQAKKIGHKSGKLRPGIASSLNLSVNIIIKLKNANKLQPQALDDYCLRPHTILTGRHKFSFLDKNEIFASGTNTV